MRRSKTPSATVRRWRQLLANEREEARIYRRLAARRTGEERQILLGLAEAEDRHAAHWERLLGDRAGPVRRGAPRLRVQAVLARWLGWVFVLALVQQTESRSRQEMTEVARGIAADDQVHEEVVRGLSARGRSRLSGTLRAAVFGANDGAVSNFALVLGVIGGGADARTVLLAGLSGLLAGALSMAAGEYVSVSSQREVLTASSPRAAFLTARADLDVNANELALVYRARGLPEAEATARAAHVLRGYADEPEHAQDETEVVGTGVRAAWSSFVSFCLGAVIPVLPFLSGATGAPAVVAAGVLTGLALVCTGATVGVLSGASPSRRALRQLAIGTAAALVTYLLGLAVGAIVV